MSKFLECLDATVIELKKDEKELINTNRKDEANFIKIRINICDICKTIYNVSARANNGVALRDEYIRQLTRLPENWKMSLEKAKEHGDAEKAVIEETKLEMLQIIRAKFEELGV